MFLDRDGTLIDEVDYLASIDQVSVFPWTVEALTLLRDAGFALVIVTNQSGVARGFFDEAHVSATHAHLIDALSDAGAAIDAVYYCPHHPDAVLDAYRVVCECRKPRPGMLRRAARDLALDLRLSYVVGDRWSDIELARAVDATSVLVRTGYGETALATPNADVVPDLVAGTLLDAARWIVSRGSMRGATTDV